ncbi:MAG: hypothetical protein WC005_06890 [Candidatus Nanopelagicales bacterium]
MTRSRSVLVLATVFIAGAALAGCSSSSDTPVTPTATPTPTPTASLIGGMTECTEAAIKPVLEGELDKDVQLMSFSDLRCVDGWAVVNGTIGDGEHGAPTSFVFEQEGQFWIPKQQQDVCGTIDYNTDPVVAPVDAQVPEALFTPACLAG